MIRSFFLLVLGIPWLLSGQEWKAKPVAISIFNNATMLPPASLIAVFNQPIHPGIALSYEFGWREGSKHKWFQNVGLGYMYHRDLYQALFLNSQAGYRKNIKRLSLEGFLEIGYMHAFYLTDRAEFQSNGSYKAEKGFGKPQFIAGVGLGLGYNIGMENRLRRIFMNYDFRMQLPFVKSYVPLLPNGVLSLGVQFNLH